jgi:hypothetical protein
MKDHWLITVMLGWIARDCPGVDPPNRNADAETDAKTDAK